MRVDVADVAAGVVAGRRVVRRGIAGLNVVGDGAGTLRQVESRVRVAGCLRDRGGCGVLILRQTLHQILREHPEGARGKQNAV